MEKSFALVTTLGQGMLTEAIREGTFVGLKEVAVGDADYSPTVGQTALVSEQARIPITNITYDQDNPHWLRISAVIAPDVGGWYIREVGIFAENGNLFAIAKLDGTYKPVYSDGLLKEITLDFILEVTSANNVTMVVDPHVIIATREWVATYVDPKFSSLEEMVRGRVPQTRRVNTAGPLSGGGDLSEDRTISLTGVIQITNGGTGNTTGLAASATKLATARSFRTNLASTSAASFDGTANVTPGVTGVLPVANGGTGNTTGAVSSTTKLATARSIHINLASVLAAAFDGTSDISPGVTGVLPVTNGGTGNTAGLAASATKLATARTLQTDLALTTAGSFNGTANATLGVTGILPIANGGTGNTTGAASSAGQLATARTILTNLSSTTAASFNGSANVTPGVSGTLPLANGGTGNTSGLAASATKLATARTFRTNLASAATASFDGTGNITPGVTGTLSVTNGGTGTSSLYGTCSTAAATAAKVGTLSGFTRATGSIVGLKFTYANTAANPTLDVNSTGAAYIYCQGTYITAGMIPAGHLALFQFNGTQWELLNAVVLPVNPLPVVNGGTGNTTGLAPSATKLATARTFRTNLAATTTASFDGTANVTPGVTGTLPLANGGTGNTTGLAASATKLATARSIQTNLGLTTAASFDGSANITPGVTGTLPVARGGTGNTTGLAASATKLATARTFRTNLASTSTASFDGSGNVAPGVTGVLPIANGGTGGATVAAAWASLGLDFTNDFSYFGHQKLPSGLMLQWGEMDITALGIGTEQTLTFPVAFPTRCLTVVANVWFKTGARGDDRFVVMRDGGSKSSFNFKIFSASSAASSGQGLLFIAYLALGY